jgi:hypothetical protein
MPQPPLGTLGSLYTERLCWKYACLFKGPGLARTRAGGLSELYSPVPPSPVEYFTSSPVALGTFKSGHTAGYIGSPTMPVCMGLRDFLRLQDCDASAQISEFLACVLLMDPP